MPRSSALPVLCCACLIACAEHAAPTSGAPGTPTQAGSGEPAAGRTAPRAGTPAAEGGRQSVPAGGSGGGALQAGSPAAEGGKGGAAAPSGSAGQSAAAGGGAPSPSADDLFIAPDGSDSAAGSEDAPTSLATALRRVAPGHSIFVRGGTYSFDAQITIERDNSGSDGQLKQLRAYRDEKPVFDFSKQPYAKDDNPRGLQINGSYWHVQGITVFKAADNGIYVAGNHNIIENCVTHGNRDTGLQLGRYASSASAIADWPSDNLILNCESYDNYDAPPGSGENADGFAAKLTVGTGNVFRGCISHHNIDDGWDLYTKSETGAIGAVTIDQCIAHHNGTLSDGTTNTSGDRNGFKLGGEDIAVGHVVTRSVAFDNGHNGFTWNSNPGAIQLSNTLAIDNAEGNYKFGDNSTMTQAVFTNNVSFWTTTSDTQSDKAMGTDAGSSNCFWSNSGTPSSKSKKGLMVSASDFAGSLASPNVERNADGSPNFAPFKLSANSPLVNAGVVPAGSLPFPASDYHGAPDLGAVEQ